MTVEELKELMNDNGEFRYFERVTPKVSQRRDVHAFLLLDEIVPDPSGGKMVECSDHDQIWLAPELEELAAAATKEQVVELLRCGVFVDRDVDSLSMYV